MRTIGFTTILMVLFGSLQSSLAVNPIASVNIWDADRLAHAGITVAEVPQNRRPTDMDWVKVSFDSSRWSEDWNVGMRLYVATSNGDSVTASYVGRTKGGENTLTLQFAVQQEYQDRSRVEIVMTKILPPDRSRVHGYTLALNRITELARQKTAATPLPRSSLAVRTGVASEDFAGTWTGQTTDKPDEGSSTDTMVLRVLKPSEVGWSGAVSGSVVRGGGQDIYRIHLEDGMIMFQTRARDGSTVVWLGLHPTQDDRLIGESFPLEDNCDGRNIELTRQE